MAFTCQHPECGISFDRSDDCKVQWKLRYCCRDHWESDSPRRRRETKRKSQAKWRAHQKEKG